jgi:4-amino-4-deoxy-L-arabinose transferase-like glycosyltransferase
MTNVVTRVEDVHGTPRGGTRARTLAVAGALALGAAFLYVRGLGHTPIYLTVDETIISLQAHAVATTGRDQLGRLFPVYFETGTTWYPSVLIYLIAIAVRLFGFTEAIVRLPMAIAGVVDVVLVYLIGRQIFRRQWFAIVAAILLAATPTHLTLSRYAMDYLMVVPFLLGWLLCMVTYLRTGNPRLLFAAGLLLGIGLYTYIAALCAMPVYVAVSCAVLYRRRDPASRYGWLVAGFLLPAIVFGVWLFQHPNMVANVAVKYRFEDRATTMNDALRGFRPGQFARQIGSVYAGLLDPRFLFVHGPSNLTFGTRRSGVFVVPVLGMLIVGLWRVVRERFEPAGLLLALGLFAAPAAATLVNDPTAIFRATGLLPFGALLAAAGLEYAADPSRKTSAALLAIWIPAAWIFATSSDVLPVAQPLLRASILPAALLGLIAILRARPQRVTHIQVTILAALAIVAALNLFFVIVRDASVMMAAATVLLGVVVLAAFVNEEWLRRRAGPIGVGVLVGLMTAQFLSFYAGNPPLQRVRPLPFTPMLLAVRVASGAAVAVLAVACGVAAARFAERRRESPSGAIAIVAVVSLAATQAAYFSFGYFDAYWTRYLQAAGVIVAAIGVATLLGRVNDRALIRSVLACAPITVVLLQFAYFYSDYIGDYRIRSTRQLDNNKAEAFELVIDTANERDVPSIYLGPLGSYSYAEPYWRFYLVKHNRLDLLQRTQLGDLDRTRIEALPPGSFIVVNATSGIIDIELDRLSDAGMFASKQLIREPDGSPSIWVLQRAGG